MKDEMVWTVLRYWILVGHDNYGKISTEAKYLQRLGALESSKARV